MEKISRRIFFETLGSAAASGILLGSGCKRRRHTSRTLRLNPIISLDERREFWEDVSPYIDNSLKNGFAFDMGDGIKFQETIDYKGEKHFKEAIETIFSHDNKSFTLTDIVLSKRGLSLDIIDGGEETSASFLQGETKEFKFGEREYNLKFEGILQREDETEFIFSVNEELTNIKQNGIYIQGINIIPSLLSNSNQIYNFFISEHRFTSVPYGEGDLHFLGLEYAINNETKEKREYVNSYNGEIQNDAYFRAEALSSEKELILKKIEKIRIPNSDIVTLTGKTPYFHFIQLRESTSLDIEIKNEERKESLESYQTSGSEKGLEGEFLFQFSPPLEARLEDLPGKKILFLPDVMNTSFEQDGRKYLIRHIAFDSRKIPSNLRWNLFYPINSIFTEILEVPKEFPEGVLLSVGDSKRININNKEYIITLKNIVDKADSPGPDFLIEAINEETSEEKELKILSYGYSNRILDLNIDPDLAPYFKKNEQGHEVNSQDNIYKFFISENKFSSAVDFFDDNQFSGLKKVIIPDYEAAFGSFDTPLRRTVEYQQAILANRFNGKIQDAFFRCKAEFGIDSYVKIKRDPKSTGYEVIPSEGFNSSDQTKNGYIIRIHSLEKIFER